MSFFYALYPSNITRNKNDYTARSNNNRIIGLEDIIDRITIPGSILKDTECRAVIHEFFRIVGENLGEGVGLKSVYLNIQPGLGGIFSSDEDIFDPERHTKQVQVSAGKALKQAVQHMKLIKTDPTEVRPVPRNVFDYKTTVKNKIISPGHALEIMGSQLKYDTKSFDEGVFYINDKSKVEDQSDASFTNLPSKLAVRVPESLPRGMYYLEVRARIGNSKTLTKGRLEYKLMVV